MRIIPILHPDEDVIRSYVCPECGRIQHEHKYSTVLLQLKCRHWENKESGKSSILREIPLLRVKGYAVEDTNGS